MKLQNRFITNIGFLVGIISLLCIFFIQKNIRQYNSEQLDSQLSAQLTTSSDYFNEVINNTQSNLNLIGHNILVQDYLVATQVDHKQYAQALIVRLFNQYITLNDVYSEISIILPDGQEAISVQQTPSENEPISYDPSLARIESDHLEHINNISFLLEHTQDDYRLAAYYPIISIPQQHPLGFLKISISLPLISNKLSSKLFIIGFYYDSKNIIDDTISAEFGLSMTDNLDSKDYFYQQNEIFDDFYIRTIRKVDVLSAETKALILSSWLYIALAIILIVLISIIILRKTILEPLDLFAGLVERSDIYSHKPEKFEKFNDYEFKALTRSLNKLMVRLQRSSDTLKKQALTDELTGLPNRAAFYELIEIHKKRDNPDRLSVMFLDLDGFKQINDNYGHLTGDLLLKAVAEKLKSCIRRDYRNKDSSRRDTVIRLGGDEFAIIINKDSQADVVANKIINELREGIEIANHTLYTGVSIGIAIYPDHTIDPELLIQYADIAMYDAKRNGKMRYSFFSEELAEGEREKMSIETAIRQGIQHKRFFAYFQPKINCQTGEIVGVEALARLKDEHGNLIPPSSFVPLAHEFGMLDHITLTMAEQTCQMLQIIQNPELVISLNITPSQLNDSKLIVDIRKIIHRYRVFTRQIEFEITEEELINNELETKNNLDFIRQFGFKTALDDFGAGYSSLGYLKKFQFDTLKLDRAFISTDDYDSEASIAVIKSIKTLATTLDMDIVSEGVETQRQVDFVESLGIHIIQGYYYSKPIPAADFLKMYERNTKMFTEQSNS